MIFTFTLGISSVHVRSVREENEDSDSNVQGERMYISVSSAWGIG